MLGHATWLFSKSSFLNNVDRHVEPDLSDSCRRSQFQEYQGMQHGFSLKKLYPQEFGSACFGISRELLTRLKHEKENEI